jgi:hypothetical protein
LLSFTGKYVFCGRLSARPYDKSSRNKLINADQTRRRNAAAILQIFDKGRRPSLQGRDTGVLIAVMQNGE